MFGGTIVGLFTKFIRMPANILSAVAEAPGAIKERRQLSSVNRLSPNNPLYPAIDHIPIQVPYHSIIGDRGKGDTPNSSDGVVEYWSSHVDGARSELIVPGPHGSYSLPQTIAELKRILKLHLASGARATKENASTILAAYRDGLVVNEVDFRETHEHGLAVAHLELRLDVMQSGWIALKQ